MIIVSYHATLAMRSPTGQGLDKIQFFGTEDQVRKDLESFQTELNKKKILEATNPAQLAIATMKLNIVNQLLTHDMNTVPFYPEFAKGEFKAQDPESGIVFIVELTVSKRALDGEIVKPEPVEKKVNILLPPGVSL